MDAGSCRSDGPTAATAIFDRSWYNRAGVEPVLGFCAPEVTAKFSGDGVPGTEKAIVDSGIILLKYWLEVGPQ